MARIISGSIDLSKIDKSRIKDGKTGQKWFPVTIIINDQPDQYGNDTGITIGQTEDERKNKDKKVYLGNAKTVWKNDGAAPVTNAPTTGNSAAMDDDLPF